MAYDSATDTALAGQAYQRALATASQQRSQLNANYGLNADGSMDLSSAGELGSIYQGNLGSVNQEHNAEMADRSRGFGSGPGLGHKATSAAQGNAQNVQAANFRNANQALANNQQASDFAGQDYQSSLGNIASKSAFDLAQTLAANPIVAPATPNYAVNPALAPSAALKAAQKNQNQLTKIGFNARN